MWRRPLVMRVILGTCAGEPGVRDGSRDAPTQALAAVTGPEGQVVAESGAPGL